MLKYKLRKDRSKPDFYEAGPATGKLSFSDKLLSRVDRGEQSRKQCIKENINRLQPEQYLSDDIILKYTHLCCKMKNEDLNVMLEPASVTCSISALQDVPSKVLTGWYEKIDKNRFVLPYNLNGNHWILICVDKPKPRGPKMQAQNTFVGFFDPLGNSLNGHLKGCFIQMITHYLDLGESDLTIWGNGKSTRKMATTVEFLLVLFRCTS